MDATEFERLCDLLPLDVNWGDPLTTELMQAIESAVLRLSAPSHSERVAVPDEVMRALERMETPIDESWMVGATAEADTRCMAVIGSFIRSLAAAHSAPAVPVGDGWLPIETAPKDGTEILAWKSHAVIPIIVRFDAQYEEFEDEHRTHIYHLTHWQPLPPAPSVDGEG